MTAPGAAGERFLAANEFVWLKDVATILSIAFPSYKNKLPKRTAPDWLLRTLATFRPNYRGILTELGRERRVTHEKASRMLGVQFGPAKDALIASAQSLIELGVV